MESDLYYTEYDVFFKELCIGTCSLSHRASHFHNNNLDIFNIISMSIFSHITSLAQHIDTGIHTADSIFGLVTPLKLSWLFGSHITALESALYYTEYYVFLQKKMMLFSKLSWLFDIHTVVLEPALYP